MGSVRTKDIEKKKRDFKIAEIVYYSIGGIVLLIGFVFSIFGTILLNPSKANFENTFLKKAETSIFSWLNWNSNFISAGLTLMLVATIYFIIVFMIFTKKADTLEKIVVSKKSRQRQVTFVNKTEETTVEAEIKEKE